MVIDDRASGDLMSSLGTRWEAISDRVMGGVSQVCLSPEHYAGNDCLRLQGEVSLANNGGFVQMALDLAPDGAALDASAYSGVSLRVSGNGEIYGVHLRTADVSRPWQSYRAVFRAHRAWQTIRLPFGGFEPHRIDRPFDPRRLRRLGLVAIGRAFSADLRLAGLAFYRDDRERPEVGGGHA